MFDDFYRVSSHAVILNPEGKLLLLKATYADLSWGLPGGALDPGETVYEAVVRECKEEIGVDVDVQYLSGIYYHKRFNSHVCIFRCEIPPDSQIILSSEHSEYKFEDLANLSPVQKQRVDECLNFEGHVFSDKF